MPYLHIKQDRITEQALKQLIDVCPFGAIGAEGGKLYIDSSCRMCKLCVKKGPPGIIEYIEEAQKKSVDKSEWKGIAVYADHRSGHIHNVTYELIGKARELADVCGVPVYALMAGSDIKAAARKLLYYGVDKVFVYDYPELAEFKIDIYTNVFEDFIIKVKPSSILVGATNLGRTLAPRLAARFHTGLTADCTKLEMRNNTDLVQIRPAFGGNIMAQIVTPRHRPQFCTVRYKIFSAPTPTKTPAGDIIYMRINEKRLKSVYEIVNTEEKMKEGDISDADVIVAVGRGLKSKADLSMIEELAGLLGAQLACTRPLIECSWFGPKQQIGLSGRTVKPKLIITVGISGSVQFAAGMQGSDCIIAINCDPAASIFDIAHYGICGDLYEIVPKLTQHIREGRANGL